jgi:hypothetical protein
MAPRGFAYGKPDTVQAPIVAALRKAGCCVAITSGVGNGFPDLCVSRAGETWLLECKGKGAPMTPAEYAFMRSWQGAYFVVHNEEEALKAVGL